MKKIIIFSLLLAAGSVSAGEYEHQITRREYCENHGRIARLAFQERQKGSSKEVVLEMVKEGFVSGKGGDFLRYDIDYAFSKADSEKDAFMKGWAYCMDNTH